MDHNMCIPSFSLFLHSQICPAACKVLRSIFRCHRRGREIMIQAMRRPYPSRCAHIKSQMPTNQDHRHQQTAEDFVQPFGSANMCSRPAGSYKQAAPHSSASKAGPSPQQLSICQTKAILCYFDVLNSSLAQILFPPAQLN